MDSLFKEKSKYIKIYVGKETIADPYEKNKTTVHLNPISIRAIISDISPASSQWKMPGIITAKTKQIIIKKKFKSLIEQSQKIIIDSETYYGWRINGRLTYTIEDKYLRCYIYIKKETKSDSYEK